MAAFAVPDSVRDFIHRYISSVEALEVLLLLRKSGTDVDAQTLAGELRSSLPSVTQRLSELAAHGLVMRDTTGSRFRYSGGTVDTTVAQLEECYRTAPFRTMELVYSRPLDKIQTFADAFRLKPDKADKADKK